MLVFLKRLRWVGFCDVFDRAGKDATSRNRSVLEAWEVELVRKFRLALEKQQLMYWFV